MSSSGYVKDYYNSYRVPGTPSYDEIGNDVSKISAYQREINDQFMQQNREALADAKQYDAAVKAYTQKMKDLPNKGTHHQALHGNPWYASTVGIREVDPDTGFVVARNPRGGFDTFGHAAQKLFRGIGAGVAAYNGDLFYYPKVETADFAGQYAPYASRIERAKKALDGDLIDINPPLDTSLALEGFTSAQKAAANRDISDYNYELETKKALLQQKIAQENYEKQKALEREDATTSFTRELKKIRLQNELNEHRDAAKPNSVSASAYNTYAKALSDARFAFERGDLKGFSAALRNASKAKAVPAFDNYVSANSDPYSSLFDLYNYLDSYVSHPEFTRSVSFFPQDVNDSLSYDPTNGFSYKENDLASLSEFFGGLRMNPESIRALLSQLPPEEQQVLALQLSNFITKAYRANIISPFTSKEPAFTHSSLKVPLSSESVEKSYSSLLAKYLILAAQNQSK